MKSTDRRKTILELLHKYGQVELNQIKEYMPEISEVTIRRDLEAMDREKLLVRIRGGAKSLESILRIWEDSYTNRLQENAEDKKKIALKAIKMIGADMSVFLDSGSTAVQLAYLMPDKTLQIFTTGLTCALELSKLKKPYVRMIGGNVNKNSYSVNGDISVMEVSHLHFNIAFLGVTGYISGRGFITTVSDDYLLKNTVCKNSDIVVIIMDSSKVGKDGTFNFASYDDVDIVISDGKLPLDVQLDLKAHNIQIL